MRFREINVIIIFTLMASVAAITLIIVYVKKFRGLPVDIWKPSVAWTRATIYFAFCNVLLAISGTLEQLITNPIYTLDQITDSLWITYLIICFVYVFIAYWILWSRMTLTFDRKYYLLPEIVFGTIWGFSTGGLLLSIYHLWHLIGLPDWAKYILSYVSMGLWQYFIQDYFWDVYVSPEHDTPRSIMIKTAVCHIPNMAISLGFLIIWGNYLIFILIYVVALVASTIFQKFPAPWAKESFHAPMTKPGILGLLRGSGYLGEESKISKD